VVRILVEGDQPIYTAARFKLDRDHWLVRGQEIPVLIDPESPATSRSTGISAVDRRAGGPPTTPRWSTRSTPTDAWSLR